MARKHGMRDCRACTAAPDVDLCARRFCMSRTSKIRHLGMNFMLGAGLVKFYCGKIAGDENSMRNLSG